MLVVKHQLHRFKINCLISGLNPGSDETLTIRINVEFLEGLQKKKE